MSDHSFDTDTLEHRIQYADAGLDRAARLRMDGDWVAQAWQASEARVVVSWRNEHLLTMGKAGSVSAVRLRTAASLSLSVERAVFLGLEDRRYPLFAVDLSEQEAEALQNEHHETTFADLRRYGPLLNATDAGILAYARAMLNWHRDHRFCGRCGSTTIGDSSGHRRRCSNADCGHTSFPRTDPAIIVLVEHARNDGGPPRCLLGRSARFPANVYSTLAGFVEPGESLENAVRREVFEESGIQVGSVRYLASQPWPFPGSLMLGFHATALSHEIERHDEELEDARWFTLKDLDAAGEWGEDAALCLPRRDSIARFLIDQWRKQSPVDDGLPQSFSA